MDDYNNEMLSEEDRENLFWDIQWHLLQDQLVLQKRLLQNGGELIMDDRFLQDFRLAWKGTTDYVPQSQIDATNKYLQQQKANSTSVDIGEGDTHIVSSEGSERIYIHTGRGTAELERDDLPQIITVLQGLVAGRTTGGALNAQTMSAKPTYETRPNQPGWMSQAEKNDIALKKALGLD